MSRTNKKIRRAHRDLRGLSFAFFGGFSHWPKYHEGSPAKVARRCGGEVRDQVEADLDYVVIGDKRAAGRADARKKAKRLRHRAEKQAAETGEKVHAIEILDEETFRAMVNIDVQGKSFAFFGGFDYCHEGIEEGHPPALTRAAGGVVKDKVEDDLDYLVIGQRRGPGKKPAERRGREIQAAGGDLQILSEEGFLELVRVDKPLASQFDFPTFIGQLGGVVDSKKLGRAFKMLKKESFQLFVAIEDDHLTGVVRSQTYSGTTYAGWLASDGRYACAEANADLHYCWGQQGGICKHLLVLLVGLARSGQLAPATAYAWVKAASRKRPSQNEDVLADTVLRYKGAQVGEVDWRPMETLPEDYYAF